MNTDEDRERLEAIVRLDAKLDRVMQQPPGATREKRIVELCRQRNELTTPLFALFAQPPANLTALRR